MIQGFGRALSLLLELNSSRACSHNKHIILLCAFITQS